MKTTFALSLLVATLLPACSVTRTAPTAGTGNYKASYANTSIEPAPPGEGPEADIPAEGPADVNANPAFIPTPLLRNSAAANP